MADILKITTPLVNRTQGMEPKGDMALNSQFNLQDITKVVKTNPQTEILKQNNGLVEREETSALLMNMLKDPTVAAATLKNIFEMQEMIKLLPVNNSPFTEEIEQLFEQLMVQPENIVQELVRQENDSCSFKGPLFDFLRTELTERPGQRDLQTAVLSFLKSLTLTVTKREALDSVANDLDFLSRSVAPSRSLSDQLAQLAGDFRSEGAPERFSALKGIALTLFGELEDSLLYSPKLEKVVSIAMYNLSRFSDNPRYLRETTAYLSSQLYGENKRETLINLLNDYLKQNEVRQLAARIMAERGEASKLAARGFSEEEIQQFTREKPNSVMDVLAKILEEQIRNEDIVLVNSDKMEKIIHSLLSSPCNFTPLLHYVLPVQYENTQAFAEIWVNPHGGEDDRERRRGGEDAVHMLLVFDVGGIGHFELELYVRDNTVDFSLLCPPAYVSAYSNMEDDLRRSIRSTQYQFGDIRFDKLERPRSLMDVFRSLPYKRTGVDVRV